MKQLKTISIFILMFILTSSFSQCSSAQYMQDKAPLEIGEVYCQKWIAGVEGGGSGLNIFIPTAISSIELDSVYFRGKAAKLESNPRNGILYIGRFKDESNQMDDIIISSEPNAEYNNPIPRLPKKIPFELKENEGVVSYKKDNKTYYFKIENVSERNLISYPSAPPNKQ